MSKLSLFIESDVTSLLNKNIAENPLRRSLIHDEEILSSISSPISIVTITSEKTKASANKTYAKSSRLGTTVDPYADTSSRIEKSPKVSSKKPHKISDSKSNKQTSKISIHRRESRVSMVSGDSKESREKQDSSGSKESKESKVSIDSKVSMKRIESKEGKRFSVSTSVLSDNASIGSAKSILTPRLSTRSSIRFSREIKVVKVKENIIMKSKKTKIVEEIPKLPTKISYIPHSDDNSLANSDISDEKEVVTEVEIMNSRFDVLKHLRDLPDINDLSESSSHVEIVPVKTRKVDQDKSDFVSTDHGYQFSEQDEKSLSITEKTSQPVEIETASRVSSTTSSSSLLTLDSLVETDHILFENKSIPTEQEKSRDLVLKIAAIKVRYSKDNVVASRDELQRREATLVTCDLFLNEIINRVVTYAEQSSVILPRLLDTYKMHSRLRQLVQDYAKEFDLKERLEKAVTDHLYRKKRFVYIKKTKNFDSLNYQRFRQALIELDRNLEIMKITKVKVIRQTERLRKELEAARKYSEQKVFEFEQYVKEIVLQNDSFDHLKMVLDNILQSINNVRKELSEIRLELLYTQHRFADIQRKSEALEDLGKGLKMRAYLSTLDDTEVLASKIGERDAELNRLHMKINYDIHALAHLKCKETMNRRTCSLLKIKQKKCEEQSRHYRELIYQGTLKHNRVVRELNKIRTSGSLYHYPILMQDFDNTKTLVHLKRQVVEKLRNEYNRLTKRIRHSEMKFNASRKSISSSSSSAVRPLNTQTSSVTSLESDLSVTVMRIN